jgi:signal transduction histidine kinase
VDEAGCPGRSKWWLTKYAVCVGSVLAATGIRAAADPVLGDHHAYTFYFAAIALTAWYSGFWPCIVATVLAYLAADWFFVPPRYAFDFHDFTADDFLSLGGFLLSALAIAFAIRALETARRRAENQRAQLAREIVERKEIQHELEAVQETLRNHATTLEQRVEERTAVLSQTVQSLEAVCYHIAHDLRAPLRAMQGFTSILVNDYAANLDGRGNDYARRVGEAANRMDKLIQSLLDYGRLGHQEFHLTPVSLQAHVESVVWELSIQHAGARDQIHIEGPLPNVLANPFLLDLVLAHLLRNALTFVAAGTVPRVEVYSEQRGSAVRLWLSDNGVGIPAEYQEKTFRIFERLQPNEIMPGTGIGLAMVYKATQRMKGSVGVVSQLGKGSRFWIELRAAETRPKSPQHSDEGQSDEQQARELVSSGRD